MFVRLLPLDVSAGGWPGPNWTMLAAFAWVLRRPSYVPVLLVAVLLFIEDLVFMRPPGIGAALTIIGLEFLRSRAKFARELAFLFEYGMVAGVVIAVVLANRLLLGLFVVPNVNLPLDVANIVVTLLAYPIIVVVSSQIFGLRHAPLGSFDASGHST